MGFATIIFLLFLRETTSFVVPPTTAILIGQTRQLATSDLVDFWRDMNTFDDDDDIVVHMPSRKPRPTAQKSLERGEDDDMSKVQFAPRIFQSSPGGDDFFDPGQPTRPRLVASGRIEEEEQLPPVVREEEERGEAKYYRILGVPHDAPISTVRAAFVALTKEHHPDVGGDPITFEAVTRAWSAISQRGTQRPKEEEED